MKRNYSETVLLPKTDFPMKADLAKREPLILEKWQNIEIYKKMLEKNSVRDFFILHDGPPYSNGHIHLGTALNKILKDTVLKIKSLQGYFTPFVPGWDCHGMPIEHQVFHQMQLKDKNAVDIVSFRKKAHDYAMKFMNIQRDEFKRLGVFGDWDRPYLTLNPSYEKTIVESFGNLFINGYIVQRYKPIYWCWHCQTALAEAEVEYWDEVSPSVYVKFPVEKLSIDFNPSNTYFLIWTTTPWTLPANVAIALHPELDYVVLKTESGNFIVAETLAEKICEKMKWSCEKILKIKGKELENSVCNHPFVDRKSFVVLAYYVSDQEGTGCVHTATGHGEEDYQTGLKYNLPVISPVDERGRFTDEVQQWKGTLVFDADSLIVEELSKKGIIIHNEPYQHSYPHCWRCKKSVIFRATKQWFLNIDHQNLRQLMESEIKKTRWIPSQREREYLELKIIGDIMNRCKANVSSLIEEFLKQNNVSVTVEVEVNPRYLIQQGRKGNSLTFVVFCNFGSNPSFDNLNGSLENQNEQSPLGPIRLSDVIFGKLVEPGSELYQQLSERGLTGLQVSSVPFASSASSAGFYARFVFQVPL